MTSTTTTPVVVVSAFKQAQARYRRRPHEPDHTSDLHEMVDFRSVESLLSDERIVCWNDNDTNENYDNGDNGSQLPRFGLRAYPGFEFWPCALSRDVQLYLAHAAVSTYCEPPHRTNLTQPAAASAAAAAAAAAAVEATASTTSSSWWDTWKAANAQSRHSSSSSSGHSVRSCFPLSWATLGYHYDWTARAYHRHDNSPMPAALSQLATYFATRQQHAPGQCCTNNNNDHHCDNNRSDHELPTLPTPPPPPPRTFHATAAIVNYYQAKSVMGGHIDDLEEAVTQPVVSVSVGRPAVFVLGGATLYDCPVIPILVRSGDVLILGGQSRLNCHSMARLLPETVSHNSMFDSPRPSEEENPHPQLQLSDITSDNDDDDEAKSVLERLSSSDSEQERDALLLFLSHHRININLRQVYNSDAV
jgi:alkylated DNA repair protein alkB homolog 1